MPHRCQYRAALFRSDTSPADLIIVLARSWWLLPAAVATITGISVLGRLLAAAGPALLGPVVRRAPRSCCGRGGGSQPDAAEAQGRLGVPQRSARAWITVARMAKPEDREIVTARGRPADNAAPRADERDRAADERERAADERERAADERESVADARDHRADDREAHLDEISRRLQQRTASAQQRGEEALRRARRILERSEERLTRSEAALNRDSATTKREQSEIDRETGRE